MIFIVLHKDFSEFQCGFNEPHQTSSRVSHQNEVNHFKSKFKDQFQRVDMFIVLRHFLSVDLQLDSLIQ